MARTIRSGGRVACRHATRGERGTDDPHAWPPDRLAPHRAAELAASLALLGVVDHAYLGYRDGECAQVPLAEVVPPLVDLIRRVRPDYVVTFGPDGITGHPDHIAVSRWVTAAWCGAGYRQLRYAAAHSSATVYTYVDGLPADAYRNYFRPGMGVGLVPTNSGQANVSIGVPAHRLAPGRDPAGLFAEVLAATAPDLARRVEAAGRRHPTFVGRPGFARYCWGRGWALVGDAAYVKDPVSAHGMTDALIGAELLARAVLAIARGVPAAAARAGYARQRWLLTAPMIPAVEHAASYRWSLTSLQRAHLAMNAAMRAEWNYLDYLPG